MATVWAAHIAPRIGSYQDRAYASGWSHTFHFTSLRDLIDQMSLRQGLRGQVTRLGIAAHGDSPGVIQLDRTLAVSSALSFAREFEDLRLFLTRDAKLIFYGCMAASGAEGSRLFNAISQRLPDRTVIGFTVYGISEATENLSHISPQTPGSIREAPTGLLFGGGGRLGSIGLLGPWNDLFAKWSRNGMIVRDAPAERENEPPYHCANSNCPGHSDRLHHCPGWN